MRSALDRQPRIIPPQPRARRAMRTAALLVGAVLVAGFAALGPFDAGHLLPAHSPASSTERLSSPVAAMAPPPAGPAGARKDEAAGPPVKRPSAAAPPSETLRSGLAFAKPPIAARSLPVSLPSAATATPMPAGDATTGHDRTLPSPAAGATPLIPPAASTAPDAGATPAQRDALPLETELIELMPEAAEPAAPPPVARPTPRDKSAGNGSRD